MKEYNNHWSSRGYITILHGDKPFEMCIYEDGYIGFQILTSDGQINKKRKIFFV